MTAGDRPSREHKPARDFLEYAIMKGYAAAWIPGRDSGGASFVTVRVVGWRVTGLDVRVTWHTRTGTYRLFSAIAKTPKIQRWHDITLKRAYEILEKGDD